MVTQRSRLAAVAGVAATFLAAGALVAPAQALAPPGDVGEVVVDDDGAGIVTMVPVRILAEQAVTPGTVRCFSVAGEDGIPTDAAAVVVNVTTVRPDRAGYAVVYPDTGGDGATPMPATSTVNFEPGRDVAASTFVRLGPDGDLCYATRGATRTGLLIDVSGYVEQGSGVEVAAPQRLLDTRMPGGGGALPPRTTRTVQVAGLLGVPADAETAILNVTVAGVSSVGNLNVWEAGEPPRTSVVNYAPGVDKANTAVVTLSDDTVLGVPPGLNGAVALRSDSDRPVHVVIDVLGWTEADGSYVDLFPERALDTRAGAPEGEPEGPVRAGDVYSLSFVEELVPSEATAVVLNVTAIQPSTTGNLRVYPGDDTGEEDPPDASSINYIRGRDIPNLVVVGLSPEGFIDFSSDQPEGGSVHMTVDVLGYVLP